MHGSITGNLRFMPHICTGCILCLEKHLQCIYYRCLQQNCTQSQKPAGFRYPWGCHWDSCSYKLNRCYWSPLRASLFSHVYFLFFSSLPIFRVYHPCLWFLSSNTSAMSHPTLIDPKRTWMSRHIVFFWSSCSTELHKERYLNILFYKRTGRTCLLSSP